MRHVHETTLVAGITCLAIVMFRRTLNLPRAPYLYFSIIAVLFSVSLACALWLILQRRSTALPARLACSHLFAAVGFAFILTAGINDLGLPLSYPQRFVLFLSSIFLSFVVPWVATDFRVLRRSPIAIDAAVVPFVGLGLYQLNPSHFNLALFWASEFWLFFGLPAAIVAFCAARVALRRGKSTLLSVSVVTAILYMVLQVTYGAIVKN